MLGLLPERCVRTASGLGKPSEGRAGFPGLGDPAELAR